MDALEVFAHPHILIRSDRNGEERWGALGQAGERVIVVVFTPRGPNRRLISARAARRNEKEQYHAYVAGRS
ncbi:BrnT family toxin [Methylobacterium sp. E-016]|nr:BrnT family toxin [Methylobacterium sp. E-016]MCJ2077732.1 BrnT family toxin [Methylobacterium sp. E-016]